MNLHHWLEHIRKCSVLLHNTLRTYHRTKILRQNLCSRVDEFGIENAVCMNNIDIGLPYINVLVCYFPEPCRMPTLSYACANIILTNRLNASKCACV